MSYSSSLTPLSPTDALSALKEHLVSPSSSPERCFSEREERLMAALLEHLDGLPESIALVASAIAREGVAHAHAQITHGLGHLLFERETWQDVWERLDASQRQLLCWTAQCHGAFDERAIEEVFGEDALETLANCVERGLILVLSGTDEDDKKDSKSIPYTPSWVARMCVQAHVTQEERCVWQHRHATYFITRAEAIPNVRLGLVDYRNLQGAILAVLPHDPELATRCCLSLIAGARHLVTFETFIATFEKVLAIRPCTPGDRLGVELLGRLGEVYRCTDRFEESVETLELAIAMEPPVKQRLAAGTRMALATSLSYIKEHDRALEVIREAIDLYEIHGEREDTKRARTCHGTIAFRARDYVLTTQIFEALVREDPEDAAIQSNMAAVYSLRGMAREGLAHLEKVFEHVQRFPHPRTELIARNNAVAMELYEGRMSRALEQVQRAREIYAQLGTTALQQYPLTLVNEALCQLLMGNLFEAQSFAQRALAIDTNHETATMLALQSAALLGDFNTLRELQDRPLAPPSSSGPKSPNLTTAYTDLTVRLAHHLHLKPCDVTALQKALEAIDWSEESCLIQLLFTHLASQIDSLHPTHKILWVHEEGSWARRGSSMEALDLRRSSVSRRLLLALVEAHTSEQTCTAEALFEAAWPGQVWNQSARVRLHTAIHRLRDRLLGELLITQDDEGYTLDSGCHVQPLDDPS